MSVVAQHGYLLIADISGYTSYLAGVELDHAHEILTDLLEVIVGKIKSLLTIAKLEGDAVFAYALESKVTRGETLLELVEFTYAAFHDRITSSRRHTTCQCRACQNMPTLDLKFFIHHGDYIVQDVMGIHELVGSDVNLIHRLLKNHVTVNTGWKAYAMLTERALDYIGLRPTNMHKQIEVYEHLGETKTFSYDLKKRYQETVQSRRIIVDKDDADMIVVGDFTVPPPIAWEWIQDPVKRNLWGHDVAWSSGDRPRGRMGSGASNHCAHGKGVLTEVVLDWRPFEYSTTEAFERGKKLMTETFQFEQLPGGGTRVYDIMKMEMPLPRPLRRLVGRIYAKTMKMEETMQKVVRLAAEEHNNHITSPF